MDSLVYLFYVLPTVLLLGWFIAPPQPARAAQPLAHEESRAADSHEPASLHPIIDPARCIGCGSCVKACPEEPEHHVLGIVGGRAQLVSPADCIGHGALQGRMSGGGYFTGVWHLSAAAPISRFSARASRPACRAFSSPVSSVAWDSSATHSSRAARQSRPFTLCARGVASSSTW